MTDEEVVTVDNPPKGEEKAKKPLRRTIHEVEVLVDPDFSKVVSDSIIALQKNLTAMQVKPTMAEYLKLLELARELRQDTDDEKEVQVKWIAKDEDWSDME